MYTQGKRFNHPLMRMVIGTSVSEGDPGRVAFACPKRVGHAVCRNRSKRVLRETARREGLPLPGRDVILFATKRTAEASPAELSSALTALIKRARVHDGRRG